MYYRVSDNRADESTPSSQRVRSFNSSHRMEVVMFNVGSGEAALVIFPGRRAWLMDCGANSAARNEKLGLRMLDYLDDNRVTLEAVVPSHSHFDFLVLSLGN